MRYGYFDEAKREYVIDRMDLPTSWTNYLGVEDTCVVVNHTAGGYMFYQSPEYHRVSRFRGNSVPMDRPGHYVYLSDEEDGDYWSISWQPVAKSLEEATYRCRHGMSYTTYECEYKNIHASQTLFVPRGEDVEIWDVILKNNGSNKRTLDIFSYMEFSFHHIAMDNQNFQMSLYCSGSSYEDGIIQNDLFYEEFGFQYFASSFEPDGYDCVRDQFLGSYRTEDHPIAVESGRCSNSTELGNNHCGSLMKQIVLLPGEEVRFCFLLGEGNRQKGKEVREKYSHFDQIDLARKDLRDYWEDKFEQLSVSTPNQHMNTMLNTWNLYQAEINILFSRFASFIEVGGRTGLGYRDTAQDAMTIPHSNPGKCRQRIIELLRGLTTLGYGLHLFQPEWFDPDKDQKKRPFQSPTVIPEASAKDRVHGIKDACSDDALWLIPAIHEYIRETGEIELLNEFVSYADGGEGTVYEHMIRILEFSSREVGKSGVCKGLRADWNDCLNLGGGESAMVTFLHHWALDHFIQMAEYVGDTPLVEHFRTVQTRIRKIAEEILFDESWYIRGITASGRKIGTRSDNEGKVHLESNAWAVLSQACVDEHGKMAMDAVKEYLFTPYGLMLNAPSYTKPDEEIGFVTRVYPGIKENGAVFSHPNPWAWAAECVLGRGDQAMEYYNALCPAAQNDQIEIREAEPYSYCQFVMGRDHTAHGRARHPFMTGTGGWAYFSATRYILGIRPGMDELVIDPCIPKDWKQYSVVRRFRGAKFEITVENPHGVSRGVEQIYLDGEKVEGIRIQPAGTSHTVRIVMGKGE